MKGIHKRPQYTLVLWHVTANPLPSISVQHGMELNGTRCKINLKDEEQGESSKKAEMKTQIVGNKEVLLKH